MNSIRLIRTTGTAIWERSFLLRGEQARGFAKATRTAARAAGPNKGIAEKQNIYTPPTVTPISTSDSSFSSPPPPPPPVSKGFKAKLVDLWKNYGLLFIGTYGTVYISTFAGFYFLIDGNYLNVDSMGISYDGAIEQVRINRMLVSH